MIRSDLVLRLAAQNPHLYDRDCQAVVDAIIGRITDALVAGDRVEIRGFGSFAVKEQRARQGRNPRTGEHVSVPTKAAIAFKPGREMRGRLNPASSAPSITGTPRLDQQIEPRERRSVKDPAEA